MHVVNITREELEPLRQAFSYHDFDNDGKIDRNELLVILMSLVESDVPISALRAAVGEMKEDAFNYIHFPGFLAAIVRNKDNPYYNKIRDSFLQSYNNAVARETYCPE